MGSVTLFSLCLFFAFVCFVVCFVVAEDEISIKTRIVGGRKAGMSEIPYQAGLISKPEPGEPKDIYPMCGGTIIEKNWVVTAAHCVKGLESRAHLHQLILGGIDPRKAKGPFVANVVKFVPHPGFQRNPRQNDIALIQTKENLIVKNADGFTRAASLPKHNQEFEGETAKASGYGFTSWEGEKEMQNMENPDPFLEKTVDLQILSDEECKKKNPRYRKDHELCAASHKDENVCYGDSGGPLAIHQGKDKFTLVGVVSHGTMGTTCGTADNPGYFTKVSRHIPWIQKVMSGTTRGTSQGSPYSFFESMLNMMSR